MRFFITIILIFVVNARITIPVSRIKLDKPVTNQLPYINLGDEIERTAQALLRPNNFKEKEYSPFNLTIKNSKDLYYYGQITAGSENKTFNILFDTGSSALWLSTEDCQECPAKNRLSCKSSTTCEQSEYGGAIEYGTGYVKGYLGAEMIGLTPDFKVRSPILWVIQGRDLANYELVDGFMGFGSIEDEVDYIDLAYDAGYIQEKVFSFHLDSNQNTDGSSTSGSYLTIGEIPEDKVNNLTWLSVTSSAHWATRVSAIKIGNKSVNIETDSNSKEVLFDSGASLLILSRPVIAELSVQLLKVEHLHTTNGSYYWPCDEKEMERYPNITFNLKGLPLNVTAYSYFLFSAEITNDDRKWCELAITTGQFGFQVLGDAFLRNNFVVFSKRNQTIGIYTPGFKFQELPDGFDGLIYIGLGLIVVIILLAFILMKNQLAAPPRAKATLGRDSLLRECQQQENMVKNQDL